MPIKTIICDLKFGDVFTLFEARLDPFDACIVDGFDKSKGEIIAVRPFGTVNSVGSLVGLEKIVLFETESKEVFVWDNRNYDKKSIWD